MKQRCSCRSVAAGQLELTLSGFANQVEVVDTHTHILSTFEAYLAKYPEGSHASVKAFVKALLMSDDTNRIHSVVDVWCEAPLKQKWLEVVASLGELKEEGLRYSFVVGESAELFSHRRG